MPEFDVIKHFLDGHIEKGSFDPGLVPVMPGLEFGDEDGRRWLVRVVSENLVIDAVEITPGA